MEHRCDSQTQHLVVDQPEEPFEDEGKRWLHLRVRSAEKVSESVSDVDDRGRRKWHPHCLPGGPVPRLRH
jgi:hypothetical protein